ncbi:hypothetical protein GPECTOR_45g111 [Gonium pectorale]|uniref:U-box domain-containing protein n=1 Tax=Gonium pectorale TaxID=33097 RepID=A0A150G8V1_GONPE|nr:hypothetical protein GPECTOR_45g111 [Gonium pectorale]|eukprot:KXZ46241.1 hypothetical protein GPECTOR_45g111 [Gonium pectorale]
MAEAEAQNVNLVELFQTGDNGIERRRTENLFRQLDERQLTEDEQRIIEQRVELQRKMFQEYERRERERKLQELREVCPDLDEETARLALEACNWREEETAERVSSDPAFLRRLRVQGGAAAQAEPAPAPKPERQRSGGSKAPVGPRPRLVDPSQVGAVFVGRFKGRLGPHQISAMGKQQQQQQKQATAVTGAAAPRLQRRAASGQVARSPLTLAADAPAAAGGAGDGSAEATAAAKGSDVEMAEAEGHGDAEPASGCGEEGPATDADDGEDGLEPNSADMSDNELQYEDDVRPVMSPLAQAARKRQQRGEQEDGEAAQPSMQALGQSPVFRYKLVAETSNGAVQSVATEEWNRLLQAQQHPQQGGNGGNGALPLAPIPEGRPQQGQQQEEEVSSPPEEAGAAAAAPQPEEAAAAAGAACGVADAAGNGKTVSGRGRGGEPRSLFAKGAKAGAKADDGSNGQAAGRPRRAAAAQAKAKMVEGADSDDEAVGAAGGRRRGSGAAASDGEETATDGEDSDFEEEVAAAARGGEATSSGSDGDDDEEEEDDEDDFVAAGSRKRRAGGASARQGLRARLAPRRGPATSERRRPAEQPPTAADATVTVIATGAAAPAPEATGKPSGPAPAPAEANARATPEPLSSAGPSAGGAAAAAAAAEAGPAADGGADSDATVTEDESPAGRGKRQTKAKKGKGGGKVVRSTSGGSGSAPPGGGAAISASGHTCRGRVKQKGVKRADLLSVGNLVARQGWYNAGYIFPAGFKAQTLFRSSVDLDSLTLHTCEVLGEGGPHWPAPTFVVTAADRPDEPLIAKSCTGCWTAVLKRINGEIEGRRAAGEDLPPPPKTAIAGPEYFGLNQPEICAAIEALDVERQCTAYWAGKQDREAVRDGQAPARGRGGGAAAAATAAAGGGGAAVAPRAPRAPRSSAGGAGRGKRGGRRTSNADGSESEGADAAVDEDAEATYAGNRWSAVSRAERYRKRREDAGEDAASLLAESRKDNPLPGFLDPITLEPVVNPAISPYGHVMGLATWKAVLAEHGRCPFTKQPLSAEALTVLTKLNIERYRSRIIQQC